MSIPRPWRIACLFTALAVAGPVHAVLPNLTYDGAANVLEFETPPVYDLTRQEQSTDGSILTTWDIRHDATGRIHGTSSDVSQSTGQVELTTTVSGRIHTRDGLTFVRQKLLGRGEIGNGDSIRSIGLSSGQMQGWGSQARFVGSLRMKTCTRLFDPIANRHRTICNQGSSNLDLDYGNAGTWKATFILRREGGRIEGSGAITTKSKFQTGRTRAVEVSGAYRPGGISVVKLDSPGPDGFGVAKLSVSLTEDTDGTLYVIGIHEAAGKLLGQRFDEVIPWPE